MPTPTKIERYARREEVVRWLSQKRTYGWIAEQLNEEDPNVRFTPGDVSKFARRLLVQLLRPPEAVNGSRTADRADALELLQRSIDAARSRPVGKPWDRETRETILTELKVAMAKLELLGELSKNKAESKVAVRVRLEQAPEGSLGELVWQILEKQPKKSTLDAGGARASDTNPETIK